MEDGDSEKIDWDSLTEEEAEVERENLWRRIERKSAITAAKLDQLISEARDRFSTETEAAEWMRQTINQREDREDLEELICRAGGLQYILDYPDSDIRIDYPHMLLAVDNFLGNIGDTVNFSSYLNRENGLIVLLSPDGNEVRHARSIKECAGVVPLRNEQRELPTPAQMARSPDKWVRIPPYDISSYGVGHHRQFIQDFIRGLGINY